MSKRVSLLLAGTLMLALYTGLSLAHDPKEHKAESPDCAALKEMDVSQTDKNDPVMKAMLQKCQDEQHADDRDNRDEHTIADSHHSDEDSSAHESH
ncbi:MAG: hypothetical protein O7E57_08515 [Gammaproteobacteria bacterium]|nr:hypothetical protein [Gammaproteobacteria bacterium]